VAVKNKKIQYHSFMANQDRSTLTLAFLGKKDKKQLILPQIGPHKVKSKSSWQKTLIFAVLSTFGLTFPFKAMASSETVTASIPIPVQLVSEAQSSVESENIPSSITIVEPLKEEKIDELSPNLIAQTQPSESQTTPTPQITPTPQTTPTPESTTESPTPAEEPRVLVSEVSVVGVEGELQDLVFNTIRTNPGRTTTRSRLQEDINAIYATGYFSNVKVTPEDTQYGVKIVYEIQPNPVLEKVEIQTLPEKAKKESSLLPPEVIEKAFIDQYGKILNLRDLQEGITEINKWYTDNGYDLAQVVGAPQISENGVVTLIIAEGRLEDIKVRFFNSEQEEIESRTRDFIVTREIQLKPGDVFNRRTAQQDLQRVFGLGLFEDVKLSFSPGKDPSEVVMNVDIVPTNTGSLAAGAGISSTSGIFGTVSYQEKNLGGNNQTVGVEFQLGERELLFDLSFQDPWIGGDPFRTSYSANIFRRRSISLVYDGTDTTTITTAENNDSPRVVRTGAGLSFSRPIAKDPFSPADWVISGGLQYQNIEVQDADGDRAPRSAEQFGNQKLAYNAGGVDDLITVRLNASKDTRDNGLRPTNGSLLLLGMEQTLPLTSILYNRLRANYSYYLPLKLLNFDFMKGPQTLAFNVQGGTVLGDLPPYEAFVIGGSNSVRGYGEGDLGNGRSFAQVTAEYRFPIVSFLAGTFFFDYGTTLGSQGAVIGKPAEVRGLNGDGFGYGLGVRVQSPVGPIRIDYAINDEGDSRIHFGIGEKF
jgi:outer membrane protein insertion porin family